ncbi:glucose-1-phosphate cytidylyltransferase [Anaerobacillus arseniciselenatis]|uniref:Glucose-1-phosphate cytidylyltransferase n=1 Tax=Anaerobacillus arseniciselenatis TaxID=85682 RepID=A0A1S2LE37_9BACI|nr:glucose-1-phosphate cytidylyltransferase [Anaerobacillus arseniciselenatis]OIJ10768.1 glucose-1-phosphate cytidylyltransferase [Anaerobacillus arseniciselenatis]
MKVVILAGGFGTRISEETHLKPKPMIEIGDKPMLCHIMKLYSSYGFNDFIICLGYKSYVVKEYFANYFLYNSDVSFDFRNGNKLTIHEHSVEPWKVTLVDTGLNTLTGGRIKKIQKYVGDEPFMLTYGDGIGDINIKQLVEFHRSHGKFATVTSTQPKGRFGVLSLSKDQKVETFQEKIQGDGGWINAGFFVLQPEVFNYITKGDQTIFEKTPLENLAKEGQLMAFKHSGFWHPMDTLRDKKYLEEVWLSGKVPWLKNK